VSEHKTRFEIGEEVFTVRNDDEMVRGEISWRKIVTNAGNDSVEYCIVGRASWTADESRVMTRSEAMAWYWKKATDDFMALFGGAR